MRRETGGNPGVAETTFEMEAIVRAEDRDRYVATLFAPAAVRPALFALHAYDLALADVVRTTTEAQIGLIRLAWWRDSVETLHEKPIVGQPVLAAIAEVRLAAEPLAALAEAYMDVLEGSDASESGACLFRAAAVVLGVELGESIAEAGRFWAQASVRRGDSAAAVAALPRMHFASGIRPITALAAVARRDAAGKREPRGTAGRQFAILRHIFTGRV